MEPNTNYLVVEIVTNNYDGIRKCLTEYRLGRLGCIFSDNVQLSAISTSFKFNVWLNEDGVRIRMDQLKTQQTMTEVHAMLGVAQAHTYKHDKADHIYGNVCKAIISNDHYTMFDLYSKLHQIRDTKSISNVLHVGQNVLHMVVSSGRTDLLRTIFYSNLWGKTRNQTIDPMMDSQNGGYTPRGLAEKYLFKPEGPAMLEEYDHYDRLWLKLPPLHAACLACDHRKVKQLVRGGAAVNALDMSGAPCFLYACAAGPLRIITYLIKRGADASMKNSKKENGLILAAMFAKDDVVDFILKQKCSLNKDVDELQNRAIDYVAMNGDIRTLNIFNSNEIAADAKLVSIAAKNRQRAMVEELVLNHGLSFREPDQHGRTPFLNAAAQGDLSTMQFILQHEYDYTSMTKHKEPLGILLDLDEQRRNALHIVAEFGHDKACKFLLAEINKRNCLPALLNQPDLYTGRESLTVVRGRDRGHRAWHYISVKRGLDYLFKKRMISGQVDVKLFGNIHASGFGLRPSQHVAETTVDRLLKSSLVTQSPDMTPLSVAVYMNNINVAMQLLENSANVNVTDFFECAPLHYAAMRGNMELAKRLEEMQADTTARNNDGKSPADIAEENEHVRLVNFIRGKEIITRAKKATTHIEKLKDQLSLQSLDWIRANGGDVTQYISTVLRKFKATIGTLLHELGSEPILEQSNVLEESELLPNPPLDVGVFQTDDNMDLATTRPLYREQEEDTYITLH